MRSESSEPLVAASALQHSEGIAYKPLGGESAMGPRPRPDTARDNRWMNDGGIEETSASCEARYAPRSYPTSRDTHESKRPAPRTGLRSVSNRSKPITASCWPALWPC